MGVNTRDINSTRSCESIRVMTRNPWCYCANSLLWCFSLCAQEPLDYCKPLLRMVSFHSCVSFPSQRSEASHSELFSWLASSLLLGCPSATLIMWPPLSPCELLYFDFFLWCFFCCCSISSNENWFHFLAVLMGDSFCRWQIIKTQ